MGYPALKQPPSHMTVDEFLDWDDGTDTRYELIGGEVFAVNPPLRNHTRAVANLAREVGSSVTPPCGIDVEAGLRPLNHDDVYFQADAVVSCVPISPKDLWVPDPVVIFEVLSPSTEGYDRGTKVPIYRAMPTVQEIVLLSTMAFKAELWRRSGGDWTVSDIEGKDALLHLTSINVKFPLEVIYSGVAFETEKTD
nr:conserved uncharacterized protein [uncultured bacterium]